MNSTDLVKRRHPLEENFHTFLQCNGLFQNPELKSLVLLTHNVKIILKKLN